MDYRLEKAGRIVHAGGVIAYPTEAVYGLGCDPWNADAVARILEIKGRSAEKGLILIATVLEQLLPFVAPLPIELHDKVMATWPGPVTWVMPVRPTTPDWLTGGRDTIAVRVTDHPIASNLCRASGTALVSTSLNRAGAEPLRCAADVRFRFGSQLDWVVSGAVGGLARPTTIMDARTGKTLRP